VHQGWGYNRITKCQNFGVWSVGSGLSVCTVLRFGLVFVIPTAKLSKFGGRDLIRMPLALPLRTTQTTCITAVLSTPTARTQMIRWTNPLRLVTWIFRGHQRMTFQVSFNSSSVPVAPLHVPTYQVVVALRGSCSVTPKVECTVSASCSVLLKMWSHIMIHQRSAVFSSSL
jgi:hypothetical protein